MCTNKNQSASQPNIWPVVCLSVCLQSNHINNKHCPKPDWWVWHWGHLHWQKMSIPSLCLAQDTAFALGHLMLCLHLVIWYCVRTWSFDAMFTLGHLILRSHLVIWCYVYTWSFDTAFTLGHLVLCLYTWSSSLGHWMQATLGYLQVCFRAGPSAAHIPINVICYLEVWQTEDTPGATMTSKLWWKSGPGSLSIDVAICS